MKFNLSQKEQEALKQAEELKNLRNQLLNKGDEDGSMMKQFKELQIQLEKEVENVN